MLEETTSQESAMSTQRSELITTINRSSQQLFLVSIVLNLVGMIIFANIGMVRKSLAAVAVIISIWAFVRLYHEVKNHHTTAMTYIVAIIGLILGFLAGIAVL